MGLSTPADPDRGSKTYGDVWMQVDQYTGAVLFSNSALQSPYWAVQAYVGWSWPLHVGTWAGNWSRAWYTFIGIAPLLLTITGVATWVMRLRARGRGRKDGVRQELTPRAAIGVEATTNIDSRAEIS